MKWWQRHIGDFETATGHLSLVEVGAYDRLLDHYYATEGPMSNDEAVLFRVTRAVSSEEQEAVRKVVAAFFERSKDGLRHRKADSEIAKMHEISDRRASSGRRGAMTTNRKRKSASAAPEASATDPANGSANAAANGSANPRLASASASASEKKDLQPLSSGALDDGGAGAKRAEANAIGERVIDYLNTNAGTRFETKGKAAEAHLQLIRARLSEGRTEADMIAVIDMKIAESKAGNFDHKYLRPATLFNREKWANYFGQLGARTTIAEVHAVCVFTWSGASRDVVFETKKWDGSVSPHSVLIRCCANPALRNQILTGNPSVRVGVDIDGKGSVFTQEEVQDIIDSGARPS